MLVFGEAGQPSAPLQQFKRPSGAGPAFRAPFARGGFPTEMQPFATMPPYFASLPRALMGLQRQAGPAPAPAPAPTVPTAAPNGMPAPVRVRAQRMIPPYLVQTLGIMPWVGGGLPSGQFNPALVQRNPLQG